MRTVLPKTGFLDECFIHSSFSFIFSLIVWKGCSRISGWTTKQDSLGYVSKQYVWMFLWDFLCGCRLTDLVSCCQVNSLHFRGIRATQACDGKMFFWDYFCIFVSINRNTVKVLIFYSCPDLFRSSLQQQTHPFEMCPFLASAPLKVQLLNGCSCVSSGERPDRPGGGAGREDQRLGKFSRGAPAETGLHWGDAATGK